MSVIENGTTYRVAFFMAATSDGRTGVSGLSPTVTLSKNGAAKAAAAGTITEQSDTDGWYYIDLTAADTGTDGPLIFEANGTGALEWRDVHRVITIGDVTLAAATMNQIADHTLRRNFATAESSSDGDTLTQYSLIGGVSREVNKVVLDSSGLTITVYKNDGSTSFYVLDVDTDAGATNPIISQE